MMVVRQRTVVRRILLFLVALPLLGTLKPETNGAFEDYARQQEQRMSSDLLIDKYPKLQEAARRGEYVTRPIEDLGAKSDPKIPSGQVQHWYGAVFIQGATLAHVKAAMSDYSRYKEFYAPDVVESKLLANRGDEYDAYLKLHKQYIIPVDLHTTYHVQFRQTSATTMTVRSVSTRITGKDKDDGDDDGLLWRLNSYWRFKQTKDGVWAECEAISLSRSTPLFLKEIIGPFIKKFPRESMASTLAGTQRAVLARMP